MTADTSYYTGLQAGPMRVGFDHSRRGTTAEWSAVGASLVPGNGQICKDTTAGTVRVGDGVTPYASLPSEQATVATGTATLVAGAVTVTNANTTANTVVAVSAVALGGTPGALFVAAKTPGTSFQIQSTSNTDTSTIQYRILSW